MIKHDSKQKSLIQLFSMHVIQKITCSYSWSIKILILSIYKIASKILISCFLLRQVSKLNFDTIARLLFRSEVYKNSFLCFSGFHSV